MNAVRDKGISLRGVSKTYGLTVALAQLDLDLRPGEVLGVAGPNGAGKSTLVRMIAGEERPDVDDVYMSAVQLLKGRGGWPLSAWLTPELEPFEAGTYYRRDRFLRLLEDLNADSLDLVELIMSLEEEFSTEGKTIEIADEDAEKILTVGNAVSYITDQGITGDD